jgi:prepilin-type N-terminal cleavage/methylation domain-containing protein
MRSRLAQQGGFSLIELLIVSTLFLVIAGATLSSFNSFERRTGEGVKVAEQVDIARTSLDRASRQLRNLARRIDVPVIKRAVSNDLVFQTSAPDKRWMRYCLQTTSPSTTGRSRLYALESSDPTMIEPSAGMMGACPGTGWTRTRMASDYVVNAYRTPAEPVFRYQCTEGSPVGCPRAANLTEDSSRLKHIAMTLTVDLDPVNARPKETRVASSVFLRNQNEPPVASFTWTSLGGRKVLLNGSSSSDPEGRTLRFYFFKGAVPTTNFCSSLPDDSFVYYTGVAPTYTFGSGETSATFTLVVCDAGDLLHTSSPQVVSP